MYVPGDRVIDGDMPVFVVMVDAIDTPPGLMERIDIEIATTLSPGGACTRNVPIDVARTGASVRTSQRGGRRAAGRLGAGVRADAGASAEAAGGVVAGALAFPVQQPASIVSVMAILEAMSGS